MKTLGIIPARYASSRFPGKPLALLAGRSILQRVYDRARSCESLDRLVVATDDDRIFEHVRAFGGEVLMTDPGHHSGTDRCAEVARRLDGYELVVNIQGDEPFVDPGQIHQLTERLSRPGVEVATLAKRIFTETELFNPNVVKVVFGIGGRALYFSRSTIPYLRGVPREDWPSAGEFFKHIGLYGFRHSALLEVSGFPPGKLERYESLEQLRWLEKGIHLDVSITHLETIGIDTPEDLEKAEKFLENEQ